MQALLQQGDQLLLAHPLPPPGHRGSFERQLLAEEFFAAEQLVIGVLQPPLAQHLVGQLVHVLESGQPPISRVGGGGRPGPSV